MASGIVFRIFLFKRLIRLLYKHVAIRPVEQVNWRYSELFDIKFTLLTQSFDGQIHDLIACFYFHKRTESIDFVNMKLNVVNIIDFPPFSLPPLLGVMLAEVRI